MKFHSSKAIVTVLFGIGLLAPLACTQGTLAQAYPERRPATSEMPRISTADLRFANEQINAVGFGIEIDDPKPSVDQRSDLRAFGLHEGQPMTCSSTQ